jgi:hypothetical protein
MGEPPRREGIPLEKSLAAIATPRYAAEDRAVADRHLFCSGVTRIRKAPSADQSSGQRDRKT